MRWCWFEFFASALLPLWSAYDHETPKAQNNSKDCFQLCSPEVRNAVKLTADEQLEVQRTLFWTRDKQKFGFQRQMFGSSFVNDVDHGL